MRRIKSTLQAALLNLGLTLYQVRLNTDTLVATWLKAPGQRAEGKKEGCKEQRNDNCLSELDIIRNFEVNLDFLSLSADYTFNDLRNYSTYR
ncbi:MAG: hypothetical protein F6K14_27485 [Symploca sp. SIO2C1]|nr:hypothetical protein [Symploca sp. SIO2C1]